ncbi:hypothetical protein AOLI_G00207450 [Acnodon oligacanthus]
MCVSVGQDTKRREPLAFDQTPLGTGLRSPGDEPLVLLIGSTLTGGHSPDTNQSHGTKHDLQPIIKSGDGVISMKGFHQKGLPREDRKKELQDDSATTGSVGKTGYCECHVSHSPVVMALYKADVCMDWVPTADPEERPERLW